MTKAQELGKFAEDIAAEYLISLGWKVLARNFKNKHGELDIIAADVSSKPEELVIVEVRCRSVGKVQSPFDSIGPRKLRTLVQSSMEFINEIEWEGFWRIDMVGITMKSRDDPNDWELEHLRDITAGMNFLFS
ncbi:MAG: YraN family protein [Synergistaceae bacterium]|nr:YraN family protein [Synergistaceae bacterium]MBR0093838.1 YraN family protein [Synergistaceae bacterium]